MGQLPAISRDAGPPKVHSHDIRPFARPSEGSAGAHTLAGNVIRILIADEHGAVREGVRYLLEQEPDFGVVGEAVYGAQAVRLAADLLPDVVIIDPLMALGAGIEAVREIRRLVPPPGVITLSPYYDDDRAPSTARAAALSYLPEDAQPDELPRLVRAAAQGLSVAHPAESLEVGGPTYEHLTRRELEVLTRIVVGQSNREIAAELGLGDETVKTHVSHMLAKLGVTDRTQAAVYALRSGLVPLDRPLPP